VAIERRWSIGIREGSSPFELKPSSASPGPVLSAEDVNDLPARFVADPFLLRQGKTWNLFFEILGQVDRKGRIGLATSGDGRHFSYRRVVLEEPFHISYPFVFEDAGRFYMVPESLAMRSVRLYAAESFPNRWRYVRDLVTGVALVDPCLFRHLGRWWLFASTPDDRSLSLYFADSLDGPFQPHPRNPVVHDDPHGARPGGRPFLLDGRLYRLGQDDAPRYGIAVRAFEITELTATDYREVPVPARVVGPSGWGWTARGVHTLDPHEISPGRWIAALDGQRPALTLELRRWR
jgi:hypothetical protein